MKKWRRSSPKVYRRRVLFEQLEDRIVLDAAVTPQPANIVMDQPQPVENSQPENQESLANIATQPPVAPLPSQPVAESQVFHQELNVVLVSNALDNIPEINDASGKNSKVISYDAQFDNLVTIINEIRDVSESSGQKIDNLVIIGHGAENALRIGTDRIDVSNAGNFSAELSSLGQALSENAQIQVFSCSLAKDAYGKAFVDTVSILTGADVFASDDDTGGDKGDWTLEYSSDANVGLKPILDVQYLSNIHGDLSYAPQITVDGYAIGTENSIIDLGNLISVNDQDSNEILTVTLTASQGFSIFHVDTQAGVTVVGNDSGKLVIEGLQTDVNETLKHLTGALVPEWNSADGGQATALVQVSDVNGNNDGSSTETLYATNSVSDAPALSVNRVQKLYDISPGTMDSDIFPAITVGEVSFFVADDGIHGYELWKTDGTEAGTLLVKDINSNGNSLVDGYNELHNHNGVVYFVATDGIHGYELWKSDGTSAGTVMVKDINLVGSSLDNYLVSFCTVGEQLYFVANDGSSGYELWKTSGTTSGTVMVKDIRSGSYSSFDRYLDGPSLTNVNGTLFFSAFDGQNGFELWKSNGTTAGTVMVKNIAINAASSYPNQLTAFGNTLYFRANDDVHGFELWKSDGSSTNTVMVREINPGTGWYDSGLGSFQSFEGYLYFKADDGIHGDEIWRSDGTATGTVAITDIAPSLAAEEYSFSSFVNMNGVFYFTLDDGQYCNDLWKSDGTINGTVMVTNLADAVGASGVHQLTVIDGALYLTVNDGIHGRELWQSDGTTEGTVIVKDVMSGTGSGLGYLWTNLNGMLLFSANDGFHGQELWKTNGTEHGTVMVKDVNQKADSSSPFDFISLGETVLFSAEDGTHGIELWKTDGTNAGTSLVRDIAVGSSGSNQSGTWARHGQATYGDELYFNAYSIGYGGELWKTDGTETGTVLVKDIYPGYMWSDPDHLTVFKDALYFLANDGTHGPELWKTDGTSTGTTIVKDINPNNSDYYVGGHADDTTEFCVAGGYLYFIANDGLHGSELWKTDGTQSGTGMVLDISPAHTDRRIFSLTDVNGTLYFMADDGIHGYELWKSDGTSSGTSMVKDINITGDGLISEYSELLSTNGTLFFTATDGVHGRELWKSDGTFSGTVMVEDIREGITDSWPTQLTGVNGRVYLVVARELWISDGTESGTLLLKSGMTNISGLTNLNETLFFVSVDPTLGNELYRSDGTPSRTFVACDISGGSSGSNPANLTTFGERLYFSADDGTNGAELWVYDNTKFQGLSMMLSENLLSENQPIGTVVGTLSNADAVLGSDFIYSLAEGVGDTDNWAFEIEGNILKTKIGFDYETKNSYAVRIKSKYPSGAFLEQEFVINVANINDAPTSSDATVTATEDTQYVFTPANFAFTDVDSGNAIQKIRVTQLESAGALKFNGADVTADQEIAISDITSGKLTFDPATNANGTGYTNFQFKVSDGTLYSTSSYTMTINMTAVNDLPAATGPAATTSLNEDGTVSITVHGTDVDNLALADISFSISSDVSHGSLVAGESALVSPGNYSKVYTYTPNANYNGFDSFQFTFTSRHGASLGTDTTLPVTVPIVVNAVNDPPRSDGLASLDHINGQGAVIVTLFGIDHDKPDLSDVKFNIISEVSHGTLTPGIVSMDSFGNYAQVFTYIPENGYITPDSFQYSFSTKNQSSGNFETNGRQNVRLGTDSDNANVSFNIERLQNPASVSVSLDETFGGDGIVVSNFSSSIYVSSMSIQNDGKIIVCGLSNIYDQNSYGFKLARYNSDGTLDASFGQGGTVLSALRGREHPTSMAIQSDGKIIVVGITGTGYLTYDFAVARFDSLGTLDKSFGINGWATVGFGGDGSHVFSGWDTAYSVMIQTNDKIVITGRANNDVSRGFDFAATRLNADGGLDTSFGIDGKVITDVDGKNDEALASAIQSDGKIVAVGKVIGSAGYDFAIVRYNIDGSLDQTFHFNGMLTTNLGGADDAYAVAIQQDGKIVVGGHSDGSLALARYNIDGCLDEHFGDGGIVKTDIAGSGYIASLRIQSDGKILAVGNNGGSSFVLACYNTDGSLDSTFDGDGIMLTDVGSSNDFASATVLQSDGKLVVAGYTMPGSIIQAALVRYDFVEVQGSSQDWLYWQDQTSAATYWSEGHDWILKFQVEDAGIGNWYELHGGSWYKIGELSATSSFIGDGKRHDLDNGCLYRFDVDRHLSEWGVEGQIAFNYNFSEDKWLVNDGNNNFIYTGIDDVKYVKDGYFLTSDYIHWDASGFKSAVSTTESSSSTRTKLFDNRLKYDFSPDVEHKLWNGLNGGYEKAGWFNYRPGDDMQWSGGDLNVVVVDVNDFFRLVGQYAKPDVIVVEYNLQLGKGGLQQLVDQLRLVSLAYGQNINDLAVLSHGIDQSWLLTGNWGMWVGDNIDSDNYRSFEPQFRQLGDLIDNGGQIQLYHCGVGVEKSMLDDIATWTRSNIFANVNLQWYGVADAIYPQFWPADNKIQANQQFSNLWNYNVLGIYFGGHGRKTGEELTKPPHDFVDYEFEYRSNPTTTYNMLFDFADLGSNFKQADLVYWWTHGAWQNIPRDIGAEILPIIEPAITWVNPNNHGNVINIDRASNVQTIRDTPVFGPPNPFLPSDINPINAPLSTGFNSGPVKLFGPSMIDIGPIHGIGNLFVDSLGIGPNIVMSIPGPSSHATAPVAEMMSEISTAQDQYQMEQKIIQKLQTEQKSFEQHQMIEQSNPENQQAGGQPTVTQAQQFDQTNGHQHTEFPGHRTNESPGEQQSGKPAFPFGYSANGVFTYGPNTLISVSSPSGGNDADRGAGQQLNSQTTTNMSRGSITNYLNQLANWIMPSSPSGTN